MMFKKFKRVVVLLGIISVFFVISACCQLRQNIITDVQTNEPIAQTVEIPSQDEETQSVIVEEENSAPVTPEVFEMQESTETKEKVSEKTEVIIAEEKKVSEPADSEISEEIVEVEEQPQMSENIAFVCSLTVRCDTILDNMENLVSEKIQIIPEDGVILGNVEIEFLEGDTVFDVLEKELKKQKIHFEFSKTTAYDSAYIEGIANLYEFDVGALSGWLYRVNGKIPSVGCSQYELKDGDKIEILYTCNTGRDLQK